MGMNNSGGTHQPATRKGEDIRKTQGGSGRYKTGSTTAAGSAGKSTIKDASGVVTSKAPISPESPYLPPA
jgi:hypothetical protein